MSGAFCCSHGLRVPPCGEKLFRGDGKSCRLLQEVGSFVGRDPRGRMERALSWKSSRHTTGTQ